MAFIDSRIPGLGHGNIRDSSLVLIRWGMRNGLMKEGKYIYCIIETKIDRNFGPIGIGGRGDEVSTIVMGI